MNTQFITVIQSNVQHFHQRGHHIQSLSNALRGQRAEFFAGNSVAPRWILTHYGFCIRRASANKWVSVDGAYERTVTLIQDLGSARLDLIRSLAISIEHGVDYVAAFNTDLDELSVESTENDAVEDIKASIVESYWLLKGEQNNLGPLQQRHWDFLQRVVRER